MHITLELVNVERFEDTYIIQTRSLSALTVGGKVSILHILSVLAL